MRTADVNEDTPLPSELSGLPERPSARLLIVDSKRHALLFLRVNEPNLSARFGAEKSYWVTPGGGESYEQAAIRELWEETGLVAGKDATLGTVVQERRIPLVFGTGMNARQILSVERYFAVALHVNPSTIHDKNLVEGERDFIHAYQFWTATEMRVAGIARNPHVFAERFRQIFRCLVSRR